MSLIRALVRLHPASVRERWGPALEADARAVGPRSWPGLLASAVGLWLHPVVWPAESPGRRRHRAAATAFALTLATWFVGRAATANDRRLTWHAHRTPTVADCAAFMLLGAALILPLPRPTWHAATALLRTSLRALAAPAILGISALVFVHATHPGPTTVTRALVTASYWVTLALAAIQAARIVATVSDSATTPPNPARLRLGIAILAVGAALTAWIGLSSTMAGHVFDAIAAATTACVLSLTYVFLSTLRDLNEY
jgi:hypothetical protein